MPNSNFMSDANATAIFTAYATAIKLGLKAWVGTTAEWDQLTDDQKKQYQVNFKTDDCSGESADAVKKSIADDFSESTNYAVGDYCYNANSLYKCTTAHTAGAWDSTHFTEVTVSGELIALRTVLNGLSTVATSGSYDDLSNKPTIPSTPSGVGLGNVKNIDQSSAIKNITRSGTTFTATRLDGTTFTFSQQDSDTKAASGISNSYLTSVFGKTVQTAITNMDAEKVSTSATWGYKISRLTSQKNGNTLRLFVKITDGGEYFIDLPNKV